ncbi:MAG: hypothetical protein Fur0025_19170 [Oscillatoriaceae cyanobacterium]
MKLDKLTLAQHMAFLIAVNRESNLGKLLEFCLATNVKENTPAPEILNLATELMKNPSNLPYWVQDLMGHDLEYTEAEWKACGNMNITDTEKFMSQLWQELEELNF